MLLVLGLVVFGVGGAYTASAHLGLAKGHHQGKKHAKKHHAKTHAKKLHAAKHQTAVAQQTAENAENEDSDDSDNGDNGDNAAQHQYGTRPGKGCGDKNHDHTGPPG